LIFNKIKCYWIRKKNEKQKFIHKKYGIQLRRLEPESSCSFKTKALP
jgi:hypothetical protein